MGEQGVNPSGTDHVPRRQAPREGSGGGRELTEYEVPEGERDQPGAREREREPEPPEAEPEGEPEAVPPEG